MSRDSFVNRDKLHGHASYRRSKKQEKELGARVGGLRTPASGSKSIKGDVRKKRVVRIEAKTTKNNSFRVTLDMVRVLEDAALMADEVPMIVIEFNDGMGNKLKELAVLPIYCLDRLNYEE